MQDIDEFRESIRARSDGHLILPLRKKLWLSFGPVDKQASLAGQRTAAHSQRTELALVTCRKVLPIWEQYLGGSDIAGKAISLAEDSRRGTCDWDHVADRLNTLYGGLENTDGLDDHQLNAVPVGYACCDTAYVAAIDGDYEEGPDELDDDLDSWDYSMYAAGAYSGGFPFNRRYPSDPERLREFWSWYLDQALAVAQGSTTQMGADPLE
jgi:hypothetical protein